MFAVISAGLAAADVDGAIRILDHLHDPAAALATLEKIRAAKVAADASLNEANTARVALAATMSELSRRQAALDELEARLRGEEKALNLRAADLDRREQMFREACAGAIAAAVA